MSQMRAGDLHAGAQSTRRGSTTSTSHDDFVGSPTDDVADADQVPLGLGHAAPERAEEPRFDPRFGQGPTATGAEVGSLGLPPSVRSPGARRRPNAASSSLDADS